MRRVVRQWKPCLREPSGNPTSRPSLRAEARRAGGVEEVAAAPSLHRRIMKAPSPIPTGLHHPAQGCAPRATLGHTTHYFPQPQRGCITVASSARCNPVGVDVIFLRLPRVASRTRQPWADGFYPVGVNGRNAIVAAPVGIALTIFATAAQRLARLYERKHAALEALKKSLLHQAFTGALE